MELPPKTWIQKFVDWYRNNHWIAFAAIIAAIFSAGMLFEHYRNEFISKERPAPTTSRSPAIAKTQPQPPDQPTSTLQDDSDTASPSQELSERAAEAVRFARKYDSLNDSEKADFQKKHQGDKVDWELRAYFSEPFAGEYNGMAEPLIENHEMRDPAWYFVQPANQESEIVISKIKWGAIIRVQAPLNYHFGQLELRGKVEIITQGENAP